MATKKIEGDKTYIMELGATVLLGGRHFIRSFTHIDPEIARAQAERFVKKLKTHPAQRDTEYVIK